MKMNKKIVIATGGTGGHVFPAYSLAQNFLKKKYFVDIIIDERGKKYLKKDDRINLKIINSKTIFKKNIFEIFYGIAIITKAFIQSYIYFLKSRPKIVFGMGGYSSFPACVAAKFLGIPFIIYENNLFLGKTNKYLLPFALKIFVAYSELEGIKKKYNFKIIKTGNIIRQEIINFDQDAIKSENIKILVLGGSQAAKIFGEKLPIIFKKCKSNNISLKIYQQCTPDQNSILEKQYLNEKIDFELFNFSENILEYFLKVNLVITRAGSSMMAELLNCNIPFISIPLPSSADGHQIKNAKYFEKKGYSFLINEKELEEKLYPLINSIHKDKSILYQVIEKQKTYTDKFVFKKIDEEIKKILDEKN